MNSRVIEKNRPPDDPPEKRQKIMGELEAALEGALTCCLPQDRFTVWQAARYSVFAGGKRVRPELMFRSYSLFHECLPEEVFAFAASLEMIHTYSLIHDDLPSMDDDDYRRGRPSCHIVYGEATAILAGDLLLNRAFEIMLQAYDKNPSEGALKAFRALATASGGEGMILGQNLDLALECAEPDRVCLADVRTMADLKTARLIRAALMIGGYLAQAPAEAMELLSEAGTAIGLAFQIKDDILDCVSIRDKLGKTPNKDANAGKKTYVTVAGLEGALAAHDEEAGRAFRAIETLDSKGFRAQSLDTFARQLIERTS
ncbi:MAG TPA: polyprenyl synthetase family protein [Clostridia bacterium]|nr:polyprenyl synthetase family protein [Clostridia bacterium]